MIRRLMASSAMLALMTAGALGVAQAQTQPTDAEQPAAVQQDATGQDQGADATAVPPVEGAADTAEQPADATAQQSADQPADAAATAEQPADATAQQSTDQPADTAVTADQPAEGTATADTAAGAEEKLTPDQPTLATAFMDRSVYSTQDPDSDKIGDVNDLIIDDNGEITHAVVGVGGFLGIGEKDVAVPFDELQVVEQDGEIRLIYAATKEQLEAAEAFDRTAYDPRARAAEEQAATDATGAMAPADGGLAPVPAPAGDIAAAPAAEEPAADATAPAEDQTADMAAEQPADATAPAEDQTADMAAEQPADATAPAEQTAEATAEQPADQAADATADAIVAGEAGFVSFNAEQVRASALIGREIFGPDNESIGEVSDIILQEDGETRAALVDVGGFLGVGEKEVAISFDDLQVTAEGDEPRVSVAMTKEQLEQAPAFEDDTIGSDQAEQTATVDQPATTDPAAPADQTAATDPATTAEPAFAAATQDLSAEDLIGSAVYSPNEESIGEVGDVIFDQGGDIEAVVVDVGGFLGVGEKPVAVQFDALNVQKDVNGDMRLMVNATQEQLESAPTYDENAEVDGQAQPVQ